MRKKSKAAVKEGSAEEQQAVEELSEAILDVLKEQHQGNHLEPFERYVNKIRYKIVSDVDESRNRFVRGYHVLLDQIGKEFPSR